MSAFTSLFPARVSANPLSAQRDAADPAALVRQAGAVGGWRARLKMQSMVNAHGVEVIAEALAAHFAARREEIRLRAELALDSAKKRAVADQIADISTIEREIQRMTNDAMREVSACGVDAAQDAAREEARRFAELRAALERGEIAQARFESQSRRVEAADAVAQRVLQNLAARLDAALSLPDLRRG